MGFLRGLSANLRAITSLSEEAGGTKIFFPNSTNWTDGNLQRKTADMNKIIRRILPEIEDAFGEPVDIFSDKEKLKRVRKLFDECIHDIEDPIPDK